jgi:hypothetical protein
MFIMGKQLFSHIYPIKASVLGIRLSGDSCEMRLEISPNLHKTKRCLDLR